MALSHGGTAPPMLTPPREARRWIRRLGVSALALVIADLVLGFVVFSFAVLGIFWYFAFAWIQLSEEYAASGLSFGSAAQFDAASALIFVIPALMGLVGYLAFYATRLPRLLWGSAKSGRALRSTVLGGISTIAVTRPSGSWFGRR